VCVKDLPGIESLNVHARLLAPSRHVKGRFKISSILQEQRGTIGCASAEMPHSTHDGTPSHAIARDADVRA
jgi:hypothetical protein